MINNYDTGSILAISPNRILTSGFVKHIARNKSHKLPTIDFDIG